jgi:hypothetical protein
LLDFETRPYHAQVALLDPAVPDSYPQWETGEEEAVFGPSGVVVATQSDDSGQVRIQVWSGSFEPDGTWRPVGSGAITVSTGRLEAGSVTGADLREFAVVPGVHRVSAFVHDGNTGPDAVPFALEAIA